MQGKFIVLEGPDGAGTTRNSAALAEKLRLLGETVLLTSEPTDSPIGREIRSILKSDTMPSADAVQLLFTADRANHVATVIEPALRRGETVVCDRYALSTIVYGSALGIDAQWLTAINAVFPQPDLTIITLPPLDVCMERIGRRAERDAFETENFQRRIFEGYRAVEDPRTIFVDTSGEKEEVSECVLRQVLKFFNEESRVSR